MSIKIEPWRIPEDGLDIEGQVPAEVVALKEDRDAPLAGPIDYDLHVQLVDHELIVTGEVRTEVKFICSRCADPFKETVEDTAFFHEQEVPNLHETLDLTDEVRETIILAFPNYPLCQETCHGLCPVCGGNLNRAKCGCKPLKEASWTAFSGLDNIEVKNGSSKKKKIES